MKTKGDTDNVKCRECMRFKVKEAVIAAKRLSGGNYTRSSVWRPSNICIECAEERMRGVTDKKTTSIFGWDVADLQTGIQKAIDAAKKEDA